jgi:hypothetical protein
MMVTNWSGGDRGGGIFSMGGRRHNWMQAGGILMSAPLIWTLATPTSSADEVAEAIRKLTRGDAVAQAEPQERDDQNLLRALSQRKVPPRYVPPRRGAPRDKVGGGARGAGGWPQPLTLAPSHLAHTISATPSLFWYIDSLLPADPKVVLTLMDDESVLPLAEVELPLPQAAGIQRVRLEQLGIELEAEVEYEWSISLVRDPAQRSKDLIATGYIRRVAQPAELRVRSAHTFAELGLWYDALTEVSDGLDQNPNDPLLREARSSLLSQVNLADAIDLNRGQASVGARQ